MKKYIKGALLSTFAFAVSLTSCTVEEGTEPNSGSNPVVTLYTYAPTASDGENLNPDNDVKVRFVANNSTQEVYYLIEKAEVASAEIAKDETAYIQKVMNTGTKIDNASSSVNDRIMTGIFGPYVISAVAKNGNVTTLAQAEFTGYTWTTVTSGVYYFGVAGGKGDIPEYVATDFQKCDYNDALFRYTNVLGEGKHLKITLTGKSGEEKLTDENGNTIKDENGKPVTIPYLCFRVAPQATDYSYGNYGQVFIRDIGYWQNNASFTDPDSGYNSFLFEDGEASLGVQYYVSAGSLGYGYDYFEPNDPSNPVQPTE